MPPLHPTRREALHVLGALGVGTVTFHRALAIQVEEKGAVTPEMIQQAEWIAGLKLTDEQRKSTAKALQQSLRQFEAMRKIPLDNSVPPALVFSPTPGQPGDERPTGTVTPIELAAPKRPDSAETLAFLPVTDKAGKDDAAQKLVDSYDEKVAEINLAEAKTQPEKCPAARRGEPSYTGAASCVGFGHIKP